MDRAEILTFHETLIPAGLDAPLPWWRELYSKAVETHRSIDRQLMLATEDDIDALKERKSCQSLR